MECSICTREKANLGEIGGLCYECSVFIGAISPEEHLKHLKKEIEKLQKIYLKKKRELNPNGDMSIVSCIGSDGNYI